MADEEWKTWNGLKHYPSNSFVFFQIFMRFEYALKATPKFRIGNDTNVMANWDCYAANLGKSFFECDVLRNAASTILNHPPKKQCIKKGELDFKPVKAPSNVQEFFLAIRRIRNNLFHGGKSGPPDGQRNDDLITEAIKALMLAYKASDENFQIKVSGND